MRSPNHSSTRFRVLAPRDRHCRRADRVLQHEVPADDPRHQLAHRRVGVGVCAAGDGNHRRELGVTQPGKGAADTGNDKGEGDRRAGPVGDGGCRPDKKACPDDGADAQRNERHRAQGALEGALAGGPGFSQQSVDRLGSEKSRAHSPSARAVAHIQARKRRIIPFPRKLPRSCGVPAPLDRRRAGR